MIANHYSLKNHFLNVSPPLIPLILLQQFCTQTPTITTLLSTLQRAASVKQLYYTHQKLYTDIEILGL
jgi:hypothetical protein